MSKNKRPIEAKDIDLNQYQEHYDKAGFTGKPVIVEKWKNKNLTLTGNEEQDIERGALAVKIGEEWKISPHVGTIYFETNFVKQ